MNRAALFIALVIFPIAWVSACDGTSGDLFVESDAAITAVEDSGGATDADAIHSGAVDSGAVETLDIGFPDAGGDDAGVDAGIVQECIDRKDEKVGDCKPLDQWMQDAQAACDGLKLNLDHASVNPIDPKRCPPKSTDGVAYRCCTIPPADGCVTGDISEPYKCQEAWMLKAQAMEKCISGGMRLAANLSLSGDCVAGTDAMGKDILGFKIAKYTCCPPPPGP